MLLHNVRTFGGLGGPESSDHSRGGATQTGRPGEVAAKVGHPPQLPAVEERGYRCLGVHRFGIASHYEVGHVQAIDVTSTSLAGFNFDHFNLPFRFQFRDRFPFPPS